MTLGREVGRTDGSGGVVRANPNHAVPKQETRRKGRPEGERIPTHIGLDALGSKSRRLAHSLPYGHQLQGPGAPPEVMSDVKGLSSRLCTFFYPKKNHFFMLFP